MPYNVHAKYSTLVVLNNHCGKEFGNMSKTSKATLSVASPNITLLLIIKIPPLSYSGEKKNITLIGGSNKVIALSQRKSFWIHEMKTLYPLGHNIKFDIKLFY